MKLLAARVLSMDAGTGYGTRPVMEIVQDIETYAQWANVHSSLAMHGIFFDEAAYEYSPENVEHLYTINQFAKNSTGIREPRTVSVSPFSAPITNATFTHPIAGHP